MKALTAEQALQLAQRRARDRDEFLEVARQALRLLVLQGASFAPFDHGGIGGQLRHELNTIEIALDPNGLAAARRFRRKVSRAKRISVYRRDDYTCQVCGWRPDDPRDAERPRDVRVGRFLTIGHLVPEAEGGTTYISNLRTECNRCNNGRGHSLPEAVT